jgi:hypothetical protein
MKKYLENKMNQQELFTEIVELYQKASIKLVLGRFADRIHEFTNRLADMFSKK